MWFGVSVFMRSDTPARSPEESLWEESIVLVKADSISNAKNIAERVGRTAETKYANVFGESVAWKFECIQGVYEVPANLDNDKSQWPSVIEVFSRHMKASEARSLLTSLE